MDLMTRCSDVFPIVLIKPYKLRGWADVSYFQSLFAEGWDATNRALCRK